MAVPPRSGATVVRLLLVPALVACLLAPAAAQAGSMVVRSVKPMSAVTPFSGCTFDVPPPFMASSFQPQDTAIEPHFAVDPNDPRRMAAAWMQDFSHGIIVSSSRDGGRTWTRSIPPLLSACTGSKGASADPRLAFGAGGVLYLSSMRNIELGPGRTTPNNEVAVSVSEDGGRTWRGPTRVIGADTYNDYPYVAADPKVRGRVHITYTRSTEPLNNALGTMYATSDDGGRTFSEPREIFNAGRTGFATSGQLLAQRGGRLLLLLWVYDGINQLAPESVRSRIVALRSEDGGGTWSEPATIAHQSATSDYEDPESGEGIGAGNLSATAAPDGGFYLTWHDIDGTRARLNVIRGRADGTWETPREVLPWADRQILFPMVAVTPEGTVGLMWFDSRNDRRDDGGYFVDAFFAVSRDKGETYRQLHVAGPMDLRQGWADARNATGTGPRFIGDYLGFAGRARGFVGTLPLTAPLAQVGKSQLFVADVGERAAKKKKKAERKRRKRRRG